MFYAEGFARDGTGFACKNIKFVLLEGDSSLTVPRFAIQGVRRSLIVADQSLLRLGRTWRVAIARSADVRT